jgi:nitroreductase
MTVTEAVRQRISTRAFLDDPIPQDALADLLQTAQRSPSGGNLQPWKVIAVPGDRPVYPDLTVIDQVYNERRKRVGEMMYEKIGIPKEDRAGRMMWFANNYRFFGAPVGLFMIIDRRMGHGQWAHMGMYMQTIALLAEERGWGTCMQECWARLRVELHAHFGLDENHMVYAGMAIGVPDPNNPVNDIYAERAPQHEVVEFRGF